MGVKYNKNDLIRREDARRIIDSPRSKEQMLIMLEDTPAANVVERKTGKWIPTCRGQIGCYCSVCGEKEERHHRNFCPNCGARMTE